jgi:hypothetical protein
MKVICIVGTGRSGSTLVDRIIGNYEDIISVNEIHEFCLNYIENSKCSCGKEVDKCDFWQQVLKKISLSREDAKEIYEIQNKINKTKFFFHVFFFPNQVYLKNKIYFDYLINLYEAILEVSNTSVIVESTKIPTNALILKKICKADVKVIHLIKEPFSVAMSWNKKKRDYNDSYMVRYPYYRTIIYWWIRNIFSEFLKSVISDNTVIKYETLVKKPKTIIENKLNEIDVKVIDGNTPFISENIINLKKIHTLSGNPDRFSYGETEIRNRIKPPSNFKRDIGYFFAYFFTIPLRFYYKYWK